MGIGDRVDRATERVGPGLCAHPAPCGITATTELILRADGTTHAVGSPPPPLCAACPLREERNRPIRHVEVVRDYRNGHGVDAQEAPSAATLPSVARDGGEGERRTPEPDDGLAIPPAWRGTDHPGAHPDRPWPAPQHRDAPGGAVRVDPRDFGL